jgi:peptidoglycan/xylan/chitin deacetylase (PgdA/CDA1 family)
MSGRTISVRPLVLIYHGVSKQIHADTFHENAFEEHMLFLKRHCTLIRPEQFATTRGSLTHPAVLLTFDDGLRNNAEVVSPVLRRLGIPAVFFISSRHCAPGKYLWFTYLKMLREYFPGRSVTLNGTLIPLHGPQRKRGIQELTSRLLALRPHPGAMYSAIETQLPQLQEFVANATFADQCEGMTPEQVQDLGRDPLFTVGAHTVDHPYLTRCGLQELHRQIEQNKTWLERITGRRCELFAYPLGDVDRNVLEQCRRLEFKLGFATEWGHVRHDQLAIRRIGIYREAVALLRIKIHYGHWLPMRLVHNARTVARVLSAA